MGRKMSLFIKVEILEILEVEKAETYRILIINKLNQELQYCRYHGIIKT